jgi:hypothetical protein
MSWRYYLKLSHQLAMSLVPGQVAAAPRCYVGKWQCQQKAGVTYLPTHRYQAARVEPS